MTNKQITDHNGTIDISKGPMPVISKYDNNRLSQNQGPKEDEYYANPFLPQNIQKNQQNNMGGGNPYSY